MTRVRCRNIGFRLSVALLLVGVVGCGAKEKRLRELETLDANPRIRYERGLEALAQGKQYKAKTILERIEFAAEDEQRVELEPLVRMAIADMTFYQPGDLSLIDARNLYLDFVTLYGEHRLAPYAQLQAGMCSIKTMRHPTRDQSPTSQALSDLAVVLRRWPATSWASAAETLMVKARASIAESEFLVGEYYLDRKAYGAATDRFRGLLEAFPEYEERPKVLWYLARALARSLQTEQAREALDTIVVEYPQGRWAEQARRELAQFASAASAVEESSR